MTPARWSLPWMATCRRSSSRRGAAFPGSACRAPSACDSMCIERSFRRSWSPGGFRTKYVRRCAPLAHRHRGPRPNTRSTTHPHERADESGQCLLHDVVTDATLTIGLGHRAREVRRERTGTAPSSTATTTSISRSSTGSQPDWRATTTVTRGGADRHPGLSRLHLRSGEARCESHGTCRTPNTAMRCNSLMRSNRWRILLNWLALRLRRAQSRIGPPSVGSADLRHQVVARANPRNLTDALTRGGLLGEERRQQHDAVRSATTGRRTWRPPTAVPVVVAVVIRPGR